MIPTFNIKFLKKMKETNLMIWVFAGIGLALFIFLGLVIWILVKRLKKDEKELVALEDQMNKKPVQENNFQNP